MTYNLSFIRKALLSGVSFLFINSLTAQTNQTPKDTIYFDRNWSICEEPVSAHYRVSSINKVQSIHFIGEAKDYFSNGQLAMTGFYNQAGFKEGVFIFYNEQGIKIKEGQYRNGRMDGLWNFYSPQGKLIATFDCLDAKNFIPRVVLTTAGDSLVKNGNGKFKLNLNTLAGILPNSHEYLLEAEVKDAKRDGKWIYRLTNPESIVRGFNKEMTVITDQYKKGNFYNSEHNGRISNAPFTGISLEDYKLSRTDVFYHDNITFNSSNENNFLDFIVNKSAPVINAKASSIAQNQEMLNRLISESLKTQLYKKYHTNSYGSRNEDNYYTLATYHLPKQVNGLPVIEGNISFIPTNEGYISAAKVSGSFPEGFTETLNYYLSIMEGLYVDKVNHTTDSAINLSVFTFVDSVTTNGKVLWDYISIDDKSPSLKRERISLASLFERSVEYSEEFYEEAGDKLHVAVVEFTVDKGIISNVKMLEDPGFGFAKKITSFMQKIPPNIVTSLFGSNKQVRTQKFTFGVK